MILEPTFSEGNVIENTNKDLIPILDEDYSSLAIALPKSSFINPLSKDLSLLEDRITLDANGEVIDNNLHFDQPGLESDLSESVTYTYNSAGDIIGIQAVAADLNGLEFVGGFGDYDGGNDVTFAVKDNQNNVIETFSMTGVGQATLYKDAEKEYIFFSGTDETTKVNISAISDLVFEDYTGDSLSIETTGSIKGGNITLNDENTEENSGLTLRAGIDTGNSTSDVFDGYGLIDFFDHREMVDINNYVEIVGNDDFSGRDEFFFYDTQNLYYLPGYYSSRAFGINDNTQMIGEGLPTASDTKYRPFVAYGDGSTQEIVYGGNGGRFPNQPTDITYTYIPQGHLRDINNYFETAYYQLNTPPNNAPPALGLTPFEDAYFNAPTGGRSQTVNIGYSLLNSDKSKVFGINDQRQVVGIYRQTVASNQSYIDRAFAFDYLSNSVTNLGTLPGGNYSAAYEINDQGQIVGASTSSSGSRAFIYENGTMKDMGIPYTGDPEKRDGIDINNVGQAVVTSSAGEPFIYQDGVVTNVNDWLRPEYISSGYTVTEAKGINDLGYIIAQGTLNGVNHGFLLVPTFKNVNRNINVGNISTFGETVLLEGAEVYLEGESIVTQGGNIESNGKTIVNNNLVIDSSITNESVGNPNADSVNSQSGVKVAGGDILFTDTVNTNSTGEQNLTLKAGAGDIAFKNTVGDTNPVFNLTVEGAGSLTTTGKDLTVDNELKLEVINDIATANISAQGLSDISLGTIGEEIFASTGNVTTGNIDTLGLEVSNNGSLTAGNITTSNGDLDVISLNQLTVGQLTATKGSISLISGTAGVNVNGTVNGDLGFIALAPLNINTNEITSAQDAVILKSSQGAVAVNGSISAYGEVSLASANDVKVKAVSSKDGGVALVSATGAITYSEPISGAEDISLASAKDLTIAQKIKTELGTISLVSTEGSVKVNSSLNSGFNTYVAAKRNITTLGIRSYGNIALEAELGQISANGNVRSGGGDVYISGLSQVNVGNIVSSGGDVSVVSGESSITTGYVRTDSEDRDGNINLAALTDVKVAGVVDIDGSKYSIYTGDEGTVSIAYQQLKIASLSSNNFNIGDISHSGALGLVAGQLVIPKPPVVTPIPILGGPSGRILLWIETVRRGVNAGGTAPRHQSEINPITGQPYADEAEFELVEKFTISQRGKLKQYLNDPRYELDFDYIKRKGKFDNEDQGCYGLPLTIHLGGYPYHDQYAEYVTNSPGDFLVLPPTPVSGYPFMFYDGIVLTGSKATLASPAQSIGALAEVKTGYEAFYYIANGNPRPAGFYSNGKPRKSDLQIYDEVVNEVIREGLIAKFCHKDYFLSFDEKSIADYARPLLNSDPRILASGLSNIEVVHIKFDTPLKLKPRPSL